MHVLLTGASSGIGEALAVRLAQTPGTRLSLVARREAELHRVAGRIGASGTTRTFPYDLSQLEGLEELVGRVEREGGPIDALINNAGIEKVARTMDVTIEQSEHLMRVNLLAPLRLIRLVGSGMVARRNGHIVNVTSVAGLVPLPYATHYSASKAALSSASEHLRLELAPQGVKVMTVYPGPIVTPMGERAAGSYERDALPRFLWGSADDLAARVAGAMESDRPRVIFPLMYTVLKWCPTFFRWAQFHLAPAPQKT